MNHGSLLLVSQKSQKQFLEKVNQDFFFIFFDRNYAPTIKIQNEASTPNMTFDKITEIKKLITMMVMRNNLKSKKYGTVWK